jgi:hypothetical protein
MNLRGTFTFSGSQPGRLPNQTLTHNRPSTMRSAPIHLSDDTVRAGGRLFLVGATGLGSVAPVRNATEGIFDRQLIDCVGVIFIRPFFGLSMALVGRCRDRAPNQRIGMPQLDSRGCDLVDA